jgi:hypothetical protein
VAPASDHYPILLNCQPVIRHQRSQRGFRFENAWKIEAGLNDLMRDSWLLYNEYSVIERLNRCAGDLISWSRTHCNTVRKDIGECKKNLETFRNNHPGENQDQLLELRKKMQRLLIQDDAYWRQRAKTFWYKDGDRNTKFFHASATARKKVNRILSLEDDQGLKFTESNGMCVVAKNYFLDLFQKKEYSIRTGVKGYSGIYY